MTSALAAAGLRPRGRPLVAWRQEPYDLAFGQQFLAGGIGGLGPGADVVARPVQLESGDPAEAGGDFAAEAHRLGLMTAEMHLAMAEAFGAGPARPCRASRRGPTGGSIAARLAARPKSPARDLAAAAEPLVDHLRAVADPGPAIRVHGDYHLGQVMRTDTGWFVLDFEGEPARPLDERAGAHVAAQGRERRCCAPSTTRPATPCSSVRPPNWPSWSRGPRRGSRTTGRRSSTATATLDGIDALLPDADSAPAVLMAFELDKALYELDYERAHRPDWVSIPTGRHQRASSTEAGAWPGLSDELELIAAGPPRRPPPGPRAATAAWCGPTGPTPWPCGSPVAGGRAGRRDDPDPPGRDLRGPRRRRPRTTTSWRPTTPRRGRGHDLPLRRPLRLVAHPRRARPAPVRGGPPPPAVGRARRPPPRAPRAWRGVAFAVWAPNARAVRVVGDWNFWDGRVHPMRSLGSSGVWELFIPGRGRRGPLQVRAGHRRRRAHPQDGPDGLRHGGAARDRQRGRRRPGPRWGDATGWPQRAVADALAAAHVGLRGAPGLVAPRRRGRGAGR